MRFPILLFALVLTQSAALAEVMRWVDERGVVNYGTVVPNQYRKNARPVAVDPPPSEPERKDAEARRQKDAASLNRPSASPTPAARGDAAERDRRPVTAAKESGSCEEQWREYDASYACFDPYRVKDGGIKSEAFEHCKEVKMPDCTRPSEMR